MRHTGVGWVVALALALPSLGCGDDAVGPTVDAGPSGDATTSTFATAPMPPMAPRLTPCPAGWHEVMSDGVTLCDPWPPGGPVDCGPGEAHFAGEPGCARVGSACPTTGDFPEGLPTDRTIVYVLAGAAAGGDGSVASPFARIRDGVTRAAGMNAIVAIGRGTYDEAVTLRVGVTLWGACTAETILSSSLAAETGVITATLAGASSVKNLTIGPSAREGITAGAAGVEVTVEDVVIDRVDSVGINLYRGGRVIARSLVVRDTVLGTTPIVARAIGVQDGASAELRHVAFERNRELGVYVSGDGSSVVVEDAVIRGGGGPATARVSGGFGIFLREGTSGEVRRAVLEGNAELGVYVAGALTAEDLIVRDTRSVAASGGLGDGLSVAEGGTATARRVLLERNLNIGAQVVEDGSLLVIEDAVIRDTMEQMRDGLFGRGLEASSGATLEATRVLVARNTEVGVHVSSASARLTDVAVRETRTHADGSGGRGLNFQTAQVTIVRASSDQSADVGLALIGAGATLMASDVSVSTTMGRGIVFESEASADVTRARVTATDGLGILGSNRATGTMTDVVVDDTREPGFGGHGVAAVTGAMLTITRFEISRAAICGMLVADGGTLDMSTGIVRDCEIGACLQSDGFDPMRLSNDVRYVANTSNVQGTMLPVPSPVSPIGP